MDVSAEGIVALGLLLAIVVLAIVSTRVVGRRAARTVDQVTALLERNEARFRAMVRDSNDIMAIVDPNGRRSEEHTSELQSQSNLVCRLLLEKKHAPH